MTEITADVLRGGVRATFIPLEQRSDAPAAQPRRGRRLGGLGRTSVALAWAAAMLACWVPAAQWTEQVAQVEDMRLMFEKAQNVPPAAKERALADAEEYNRRLATGLGTKDLDYMRMLVVPGSDVMARIQVPDIGVDQPLRHTMSESSLLRGLGHAERSTLPVGGASTHAVIGGHRGLAESIGFTRLPEVQLGDEVLVDVLGDELRYRVTDTRTVLPETADEMPIVPGKDLITLITCTPPAVNSHRFVVTAERVPGAAKPREAFHTDQPGFPWWAVGAGSATVLAAAAVLIRWPARARTIPPASTPATDTSGRKAQDHREETP